MLIMLFQNLIDVRQYVDKSKVYGGTDLGKPELGTTADTGNVLGQIISSVSNVIISLAAIAVLMYFLWAGYNWLTAGGDKQKVEEARTRITNALIGMAIVASALALSAIVNKFFGTNVDIPGMNSGSFGSSSSGGGGSSSDCGGGLNIGGPTGVGPDGITYRCVEAGTPCGPGNPTGFSYPFNCPVNLVDTK